MNDTLAYYTLQSPITDPGDFATLYDDLPQQPAELIPVINGLLIHYRAAKRQKLSLGREQRREQRLRTMAQRLAQINKLNPASLTEARELKERQIGWCREFAVFMVSILRHKGFPARMRVGFETYFADEPFNGDHWITEFWDAEQARWRLIDADIGGSTPQELEAVMKKSLKPGLDFTDLRHGVDFNVAAAIWKQARAGEIKPDRYRANKRWKGWPCLRGNLLHDFQALN
ncbi:MAG: transglutaminase domain-containing protein, partial [Chloroflexi bacterium]|nr:transglutaminase domain-containing protein [Chloroflexota bacterium]